MGKRYDQPATDPVNGISFGVCSDAALVDIDCQGGIPNDCLDNGVITLGAAFQQTNVGDEPDFFAPNLGRKKLMGLNCSMK